MRTEPYEGQLTLKDAEALIESDKIKSYDCHYKIIVGNNKYSLYLSDLRDDEPDLTLRKFVEDADNYGSFWLNGVDANDKYYQYQLVDDNTFEVL